MYMINIYIYIQSVFSSVSLISAPRMGGKNMFVDPPFDDMAVAVPWSFSDDLWLHYLRFHTSKRTLDTLVSKFFTCIWIIKC